MRLRTLRNAAAFTLTELVVVIGIIVLLIAIAVPALSSMLYGSEQTVAENQFRIGMAAGRDAAIQNERGDGGVYFSYSRSGRLTMIPVVQAGTLNDEQFSNGAAIANSTVDRDVFVPLSTSEPIQLPRSWSVRGYTPPNTVDNGTSDRSGWYESLSARVGLGNWVFPETSFHASAQAIEGGKRQSFMVRFKGGIGTADLSDRRTALVLDPISGTGFRGTAPYSTFRADEYTLPGMQAGSDPLTPETWARRILGERADLTLAQKRLLIGDRSPDTVLVRPVTEVALYDERRLAAGLGLTGLNRATNTIYGDAAQPRAWPTSPTIDTGILGAVNEADVPSRIAAWLQGRATQGETADEVILPSTARIYTLQRYLGQVQEVKEVAQ